MSMIKLNHWHIKENELGISLMNFYVGINIVKENCFLLKVVGGSTEIKEISFWFPTLEDAIVFTEGVVSKCFTFDDVEKGYDTFINENNKVLKKER